MKKLILSMALHIKNFIILVLFSAIAFAASILIAKDSAYKLGDRGPAGGLVFYDKGSFSGGWRYLEAAPGDQGKDIHWGCYKKSIPGANDMAIGSGSQNTIAINKSCAEKNTAAKICADYIKGGKSDWFLPSRDELNLMYNNLHVLGLGGFADDYYWSSSDDLSYNAWYQYFYDGYQGANIRFETARVRAIRAF